MTLYLKDAWWNDLQALERKTDAVYEKVGRDKWEVTAERMVELRKWTITPSRLIPTLQDLNAYYVPKKIIPGPLFVFPETDASGKVTRAQTKPLHDLFGKGKYHTIGVKKELFFGPVWMGNTDKTLEQIVEQKQVILVEGPFDLIAARFLAPNLPIMSTLTKSVGPMHEEYLKILGVKELHLMFDNEVSGKGQKAAEMLSRILSIPANVLVCPSEDPSSCLEIKSKTAALRKVLNSMEVG